jgi:hypothetical protein
VAKILSSGHKARAILRFKAAFMCFSVLVFDFSLFVKVRALAVIRTNEMIMKELLPPAWQQLAVSAICCDCRKSLWDSLHIMNLLALSLAAQL